MSRWRPVESSGSDFRCKTSFKLKSQLNRRGRAPRVGTMRRRWPRGRAWAARRAATTARWAGRRTAGCWRRAGSCPRGCAAARAAGRTRATRATTAHWVLLDSTLNSTAYPHRRRSTRPTAPLTSRPPQNRATGASPSGAGRSPPPLPGLPCIVRTSSSACEWEKF